MNRFTLLASVGCLAFAQAASAQTLASPDGRVVVSLGANADKQPTYALAYQGRAVIAPSALGLELERYAKISSGMAISRTARRSGVDRYRLVAGKTSRVDERYNEMTVTFAEAAGDGRRFDVVFRAYDSGLAFRYRIPQQAGLAKLRLVNEVTQFAFPQDFGCHGLNLGGFGTSHEGEYDPVQASAIRYHHLYELPLVCRAGTDGPAIAIAEAEVTNWPTMYLTGSETGAFGVWAKLTRRPDDPDIALRTDIGTGGIRSPWRVLMVGPSEGALIGSNLLTNLNAPPQGDFSWVKPGLTAWDWWSGPVLASVPKPGTNDATIKAFIDFAAARKLPYMMIDDGWYVNSGAGQFLNPGADPTQPIPAVNMPMLVDYARARKVDLIVWIHWALLDRDMDRILDQVERWGIKGIKVDFMNRDDQDMVGFYHRLAAATARRRLLLDLHGATHPWGLTRTYPNFVTQEGVLGAEYNKWTRRITARHNVTLAYTRMLLGPMDYTPGGFQNRTPAAFRISPTGPQTQTTRGQALAMYVVYESPLQSVADSPDHYAGQSGLEFLSEVPASWDETRFLQGMLGEYVVLARRRDDRWYVGAMTNEAGRQVTIPLSFLKSGSYAVRTWQDGTAADQVQAAESRHKAGESLTLTLAPSGGAVAVLSPVR
jgi:alpha-glucosidase